MLSNYTLQIHFEIWLSEHISIKEWMNEWKGVYKEDKLRTSENLNPSKGTGTNTYDIAYLQGINIASFQQGQV